MNDGDTGHRLAALSLGSNVGDRIATVDAALRAMGATAGVELLRVSSLFGTEPVGYTEQAEFINCCAIVRTSLKSTELHARMRTIERELGRVTRERWREREIDIDLLLVNSEVLQSPELVIPHPEMHRRRFVLEPLAEIAPDMLHPIFDATVVELLDRCDDNSAVRVVRSRHNTTASL
jgi:2-amino-4-hydroxy-6-hydroxymethyldihydropteridine diphosphokinase